ncbi:hypothetical protein ACJX0J_036628, partial [Zea mays]
MDWPMAFVVELLQMLPVDKGKLVYKNAVSQYITKLTGQDEGEKFGFMSLWKRTAEEREASTGARSLSLNDKQALEQEAYLWSKSVTAVPFVILHYFYANDDDYREDSFKNNMLICFYYFMGSKQAINKLLLVLIRLTHFRAIIFAS